MQTLRQVIPFIVFFLLAPAASAQQLVFELDPARSNVEFTLGATLHTVHGTLRVKSGSVRFDGASGAASGEIVVDAASARTGNDDRDRKMHQEVLESGRFPEIRFQVQSVRGALPANGTAQVQMAGIMTLHGAEHPMTLVAPVEVRDGGVAADVRFQVPYVEWKLKNPSSFLLRVEKKVEVTVHVAGKLGPAPRL